MSEPIFEITSYDSKKKRVTGARVHPSARSKPGPWRWPLGKLGSRPPIVIDEHVAEDRRSIDFGYAVTPFDAELYVPVYAAQSGEVSFALEGEDGFAVSIDHGSSTTHYAHMSTMFVTRCLNRTRRRQYVRAGDVIGNAARSPLHVRFELWKWTEERGLVAVDPKPELENWIVTSPMDLLRLPNNPITPTSDEAA